MPRPLTRTPKRPFGDHPFTRNLTGGEGALVWTTVLLKGPISDRQVPLVGGYLEDQKSQKSPGLKSMRLECWFFFSPLGIVKNLQPWFPGVLASQKRSIFGFKMNYGLPIRGGARGGGADGEPHRGCGTRTRRTAPGVHTASGGVGLAALAARRLSYPPTPCLVQNGPCFRHGGGVFCAAFVDMLSISLM